MEERRKKLEEIKRKRKLLRDMLGTESNTPHDFECSLGTDRGYKNHYIKEYLYQKMRKLKITNFREEFLCNKQEIIGIKTKGKANFDIYEKIHYIKVKEVNQGLNGKIFKNRVNNNIIIIIELDLEKLKQNKINIEQIKNEIGAIENNCITKYNYVFSSKFALIEDKIINIDKSLYTLIRELKERKIIEEENINIINEPEENTEINIYEIKLFKDNNDNNLKIEELNFQLLKEKENIKTLEEKNIKLEKEVLEEKDKNIKSEIIIKDLRKDLEMKKDIKQKTENETKDSLIDIIFEKDKKIKELELKLSRFPFILEEGEKLMTINFISTDQNLNTSLIYKNTDQFIKVEGLLYKSNPEYFKDEIYFLFKGEKINRYKTLEENCIKDNNIIIVNKIE